jgi:hypothetical protein
LIVSVNQFWSCNQLSIPHRQPLLSGLIGSFICTFFAPVCQSIVVPGFFVKLAFRLPLSAFATPFLFHSTNNPMGLLIRIVFFQRPHLFPVKFAGILTLALSALRPQSIPGFAVFAELTLSLPLFASGTSLHFRLSSSIQHCQPSLNTFLTISRAYKDSFRY